MEFLNLLSISQNFIDFAVEKIGSVNLNWIGKLISWLFDIFSGVYGGVIIGVIVFTLCLKTIVIPLDIYSKVKTKKQSLIMKKMRPQMEKLQKQYANDKNMYSQKVMELQKQHGYSPLSACLPMIVSLVIFIVVMGAFSTYSNFAIITTYNNMVDAYNASVETYIYATYSKEEAVSLLNLEANQSPQEVVLSIDGSEQTYYIVNIKKDNFEKDNFLIRVKNTANYSTVKEDSEKYWLNNGSLLVDFDKFADYYVEINKYSEEKKAEFLADFKDANKKEAEKFAIISEFVQLNARRQAAGYYYENSKVNKFGWIGNVWYPDSMLNKVVPNYSKFKSSISRASNGSDTASYEESYNEVTYFLTHADPANPDVSEKSLPGNTFNGYFVLIVLAIGLMFLQQFIMSRSQKDANELSSVDGSAAKTNKWIMIMMPIMYGVFSFFYSAAFSTYMIISTVYSLISTLIINKIVEVRFEKKGDAVLAKGKNGTQNRKRLK